jgi:F-type H+-transporting ATPase subunit delta
MSAVASRYARALADVVFSDKLDPAQTVQDIQTIAQFVDTNLDLRAVWVIPSIPIEQKLKLLDAIASEAGLTRQVRNFVAILIEKRRLNMMADLIIQLKIELNERMGIAEADVLSARLLADDERSTLEAQIARATGKTVRAQYEQDKSLLGGATVKVGSTIYDGSVRGQLQKMKAQIAGQ